MTDTHHDDTAIPASPAEAGEWMIVEVMGHRRHAGLVTEVTRAGVAMLRVDVYAGEDATPASTHYYPGSALFGLTPCTEAAARRAEAPARAPARLTYAGGEDFDADLDDDDDAELCP